MSTIEDSIDDVAMITTEYMCPKKDHFRVLGVIIVVRENRHILLIGYTLCKNLICTRHVHGMTEGRFSIELCINFIYFPW